MPPEYSLDALKESNFGISKAYQARKKTNPVLVVQDEWRLGKELSNRECPFLMKTEMAAYFRTIFFMSFCIPSAHIFEPATLTLEIFLEEIVFFFLKNCYGYA